MFPRILHRRIMLKARRSIFLRSYWKEVRNPLSLLVPDVVYQFNSLLPRRPLNVGIFAHSFAVFQ
eukprot:3000809-Pyramimonas_sp.AAC.1